MNIFILHPHPKVAAQYLCNAHVRSQIRESVLMLMSAFLHNDCELPAGLPEPDQDPKHFYHPCTKWVAAHRDHWTWLWKHVHEVCKEYEALHNVPHYWAHYVDILKGVMPSFKKDPLQAYACPPPCVVSKDLKPDPEFDYTWDLVVASYRDYYRRDKAHLHRWTPPRRIPDWIYD